MNVHSAHAENREHYRDEPIIPIPEKIKFVESKAALGEQLFYEVRLSKNNNIACASCHQLENGGDDNVALGLSAAAIQNIINTPSVYNAQYNFRQNWDGSIKTLPQLIDDSVSNSHKFDNNWNEVISRLSKDTKLTDDFKAEYTGNLTRENIIDAMVEFLTTLTTPNSRFDRYLRNEDGSLTKDEIQGYLLFKELGCISCHQGVNVGGNLFQKFGVFYNYIAEQGDLTKSDFGRMNYTNQQADEFVFKVPSLRNIAVTAPYLHDGSASTLEEAIDIMGTTQIGRTLTVDEILLIKAFLNTLTGEYKNIPLDAES